MSADSTLEAGLTTSALGDQDAIPGTSPGAGTPAGETSLDDFTDAITELALLLVDDVDLTGTLHRVAASAARTVADCDSAGVTLITSGSPTTAAATDSRTLAVDEAQYAVGDGPCLEAYRVLRVQRVVVEEAAQRYPDFHRAARESGIRSFLAAPLVVRGKGIGALNLYSSDDHGFGEVDEALVLLFASHASVVVANSRLYQGALTLSRQLEEAMANRAVIEQAKGALMATLAVDSDEAFKLLRQASQYENRKLREVAADIAESASAGRPLPLRTGRVSNAG